MNDNVLIIKKIKCRFLKELSYYRTKKVINLEDYIMWTKLYKLVNTHLNKS